MLYFLPTPIGNLGDIAKRCLDVLRLCDCLICEDTRVSKALINLLNSKYDAQIAPKEFYSLHTHNAEKFFREFDKNKFIKQTCVFVSDAGMPCISDPGIDLVKFAQINDIAYEVLPGANALLLCAAASGIVEKEFTFLGFLPNTGKDRTLAIQNAMNSPYPVIIYESPRRIISLIENICQFDGEREIFVIKEATKKFEKKFRNKATNLLKILENENLNGEWALCIAASPFVSHEKIGVADIENLDIAPKIRAKLLAKITGEDPKKIYANLIK